MFYCIKEEENTDDCKLDVFWDLQIKDKSNGMKKNILKNKNFLMLGTFFSTMITVGILSLYFVARF